MGRSTYRRNNYNAKLETFVKNYAQSAGRFTSNILANNAGLPWGTGSRFFDLVTRPPKSTLKPKYSPTYFRWNSHYYDPNYRYIQNFKRYNKRMPYRNRRRRRSRYPQRYRRGRRQYRRFNTRRRRFYKRFDRPGRLKGIGGPQCIPRTAVCRLTRKFAFHYAITSGTDVEAVIAGIVSHDLSTGTFGWNLLGSGVNPTPPMTTPYMISTLMDIFTQARCYKMDMRLNFLRDSHPGSTAIYDAPYALGIYAIDSEDTRPSSATTLHDMMLVPGYRFKVMHTTGHTTATILEWIPSGGENRPARLKTSAFTWKQIKGISNAKDYFNDEVHANTITGSLGSRSFVAPVADGTVQIRLQFNRLGDANDFSSALLKGSIYGSVTQHILFTKVDPLMKFTD